jgi:hypothetical protein
VVNLDNAANRRSLLLRLSLLVFGVVLATWLIPSVGTAGTAANVANVVGTPLTRQVFDHWMFVTAKSSTSRGQPVILPADPPKFTECISRVRETSPRHRHDSEKTLRDDCGQLFVSLRDQVLGFLIPAYWLEDRAFTDHVAFTAAQVRRAFDADKREQFQTPADFKMFLTETGQTIQDVIFRVRVRGATQQRAPDPQRPERGGRASVQVQDNVRSLLRDV